VDFPKSNDLTFPPKIYGDIPYMCTERGSKESLKSYSSSCPENTHKLNCSKTNQPGKNEYFLSLSSLTSTQFTSKGKLKHVVSYCRKAHINRIREVFKPAVKFPSCVHLTMAEQDRVPGPIFQTRSWSRSRSRRVQNF